MKAISFSIRIRMLITLCLIIVIVVLFSFSMFFLYKSKNNELLYKAFSESLGLIARSSETELNNFESFSVNLMTDPYVQEKVDRMNGEANRFNWYRIAEELKNKLVNYFNVPYVDCILLIDNSGRIVASRNDYPKLETFVSPERLNNFRSSPEPYEWIETDSNTDTIYYLRRIRKVAGLSLEQMGVLCFVLKKERFMRTVFKYSIDYDLQIGLLGREQLLYASNGVVNQILPRTVNIRNSGFEILDVRGKEYFVIHIESPFRALSYLCIVPYGSLFQDIDSFNTIFLFFCAGIFLLLFFLTARITKEISEPIIRLATEMKNIESEDFSQAKLNLNGYTRKDEIGTLYAEFHLMLKKIENLINDNYRKQLLVKDAQFKTLQAQINPHFLYNTLESINWIAQLNSQQQIAAMVQALGDLLRVSINAKRFFLTIEEEITLLKQYVLIQKIRYEERLDVTINIEESLRRYVIPKLTLQPFVENSIKYGLETFTGVCRISLVIKDRGSRLAIHISDNGPGMDTELVRRVLKGEVEARGSGIGIKNIHGRLQEFYNGECGFEIESEKGGGATVKITLAKLTAEEASALNQRRVIHV